MTDASGYNLVIANQARHSCSSNSNSSSSGGSSSSSSSSSSISSSSNRGESNVQLVRQKAGVTRSCCDVIIFLTTLYILMGSSSAVCLNTTSSTKQTNCSLTDLSSRGSDKRAQSNLHNLRSTISLIRYLRPSEPLSPRDGQSSSIATTSGSVLLPESISTKSNNAANSSLNGLRSGTESINHVGLPATPAVSASIVHEEADNMDKIIGIVIPFTCVIFLASIFFVTCKLCQRYRCCDNQVGARKLLSLCDRCMSTPYVFQVSDSVKGQSQASGTSNASAQFFHRPVHSTSSSGSQSSRTSGSSVGLPQSRSNPSFTSVNMSLRYSVSSSASGLSRHGSSNSSRGNIGSASADRQNVLYASLAPRTSKIASGDHRNSRRVARKNEGVFRIQRFPVLGQTPGVGVNENPRHVGTGRVCHQSLRASGQSSGSRPTHIR